MAYKYAVIGAGRQGTASAYDFVKFGDSEKVLLIDNNFSSAEKAAAHVNKLTGKNVCVPIEADVTNIEKIKELLADIDSAVSAVPYYFNEALTKAAIESGTNFIDMGGNTEVVRNQLAMNNEAEAAGISVVPDCGMGPGMNVSLMVYGVSLLDEANSAKIYVGGLPSEPEPPFNYKLLFHPNGLTNEYYGNAIILRDGEIAYVPTFDEVENIQFPEPIGTLEAAFTSGGLSTAPYTLKGKLKTLEYKTLRYPGHWEKFKAFKELGLFEETPVDFKGEKIIPREFYHKLLVDKLGADFVDDLGLMKIIVSGKKNGTNSTVAIELIDKYDAELDFTSMQKLTGWHAALVAQLAAMKQIPAGALSIETISGELIYKESLKRGFDIRVL